MSEYAIGVFAICIVGGVLMKLSYGSGDMSRLAIAIITVYVIAAPAADTIKEADFNSIFDKVQISDAELGADYEKVTRQAFEKGVCAAVAMEFSLDEGDIAAVASGFDSKEMKAEGIKVILSGRAALQDFRLIEKYVNELNIGECRVEIQIG